MIASAAVARLLKARLAGAADRHSNRLIAVDIGNLAGLDLLLDASFQLLPRPLQESLAVAQALVLRIKAAVDEIPHRATCFAPSHPALFTRMYQSTSRRTWRSV